MKNLVVIPLSFFLGYFGTMGLVHTIGLDVFVQADPPPPAEDPMHCMAVYGLDMLDCQRDSIACKLACRDTYPEGSHILQTCLAQCEENRLACEDAALIKFDHCIHGE